MLIISKVVKLDGRDINVFFFIFVSYAVGTLKIPVLLVWVYVVQ